MKPYDEILSLKPGTVDAFLALTYSVDLAWFERTLLPALLGAGARRIAIFADADELSKCLVAQRGLVHGAGLSYLVVPVRARGAFHPKAYLMRGAERTRLFVGSGNLTTAGFGRNLEVFCRFETGQPHAPDALADLAAYVREAVDRHHIDREIVEPFLEAALVDVPMIASGRDRVLVDGPGARHFIECAPEQNLVVLSPYFDADANAVLALVRSARARSARVITDLRTTTLTPRGARALLEAGITLEVLSQEDAVERSPLHAKIVLAHGDAQPRAIVGSTNASNAAWFGTNAELAVALRGVAAAQVGRLLDELPRRPMTNAELDALPEPEEVLSSSVPCLAMAERESARIVRLHGIMSGSVQILGDSIDVVADVRNADGSGAVVDMPAGVRLGASLIARVVVDGAAGPAVPVIDRFSLDQAAQQTSSLEHALRRALFAGYDGGTVEDLFALIADVWRRRAASSESATSGSPTPRSTERGEQSETPMIVPPAAGASQPIGGSRSTALSPRLLELLLFGVGSDDGPDESEGEADDGRGEVRSPPVRESEPADAIVLIEHLRSVQRDYIRLLGDDGRRDASSFLDDLVVLAGLLHYSVGRGLSQREFAARLGVLLGALIGTTDAALVRALARIPLEQRPLWHERVPLLEVVVCALYHLELCLEAPEGGPRMTVLWMRHLIEVTPAASLDRVVTQLFEQLSALERGPLWAAPRVGGERASALALPAFAAEVVADARALAAIDRWLSVYGWPPAAELTVEEGGDALIVQPGAGGLLSLGFAERDERAHARAALPAVRVWLRSDPIAVPEPRDDLDVRMPRGSAKRAIAASAMSAWLHQHGAHELEQSLERLLRLAG